MAAFIVVGLIELSHHGRSFKVYSLVNGQRVFIGLVTRKDLAALLRQEIPFAEINKFSGDDVQLPTQKPSNGFSVTLKTPTRKEGP